MALTGLDDPGLTVFPTHRLLSGFAGDPARRERLLAGLRDFFDVTEVPREELDPAAAEGTGVFGLFDAADGKAYRLALRDTDALDSRLDGKPEAYRRLDSAILETLVLEGLAGMSEEDITERRGLEEAVEMTENGIYDLAFILRPVPIEQVRAVAATDENMPPKSTYFFPKVMTGFVFSPVG